MVLLCLIPSVFVTARNSCDSNWRPWSVMIVVGTPNRAIQLVINAFVTVSAVMSCIGIASGHRVYRSMAVRQYVNPSDDGRGPTRSMCI